MSHRLSDGTRKNQWGGSSKSTGGERGKEGSLKQAKPKPSHTFTTKRRLERGNEKGSAAVIPAIANPGNVIKCTVGGGAMGSPLAHENEAPFPELLAERFIKSFCPPDGIVCDPFCGSGTSLAVAYKNTRHWVGIDVRQSQVDLSERRIQDERDKYSLFGE